MGMIYSLQDILEELGFFFCLQSKGFAPFFVCCFCISVKRQLVYYLFCNRRLKLSFFENQLFQSAPYLQHLIAFPVHLHSQCRKKFPVSFLHCRRREKKKKGLFLCATFFLTGHSGVWVLMMLMLMQRWDLHHRSFSVQMSPQKVCEISALQTHGLLAKNPQTSLAKGNKERSKSSGGFFKSGDLLLRVLLQTVVTN